MVTFELDGRKLRVPEGTTILEAAQSANIPIPHLCYLKDINEIAACRMCMVEVEGTERLQPACNTRVTEGMVIRSNTPKVRQARRTNLRLILSQHNSNCTVCVRSGNCELQKLSHDLNIHYQPYPIQLERSPIRLDTPVVREASKCIKCMRCVQVCDKIQEMHVWDQIGTGSRATVAVSHSRYLKDTDCTFCGQCVTHCPTGALTVRDDTGRVLKALAAPEITTVVQVAPAVRVAWAESWGLGAKYATAGRIVTALKRMGFDYVFDTNFTADLTIMEEGSEFFRRLQRGDMAQYPMFTSCCPGWVRFLKGQYPQLTGQLSTAKSPQQMFGSLTKSWLAQKLGVEPEKIFCVSIMPCVAKKAESELPTMATEHGPDVDLVLTTREFVRMLRADKIIPSLLPEEGLDDPMGVSTGAGVIFGTTGGVMEAALRSASFLLTGQNPDPEAFSQLREGPDLREATYDLAGTSVRCAVVSGLGNTRKLLDRILAGKIHYDFVEVMACPGGCVGGGGQPIDKEDRELGGIRGDRLHQLDGQAPLRFSHENPQVQALYREFLGKPLSEISEYLLHSDHTAWAMPNQRETE